MSRFTDEYIGQARIWLARRLGRHQGEILHTGLGRWRRYDRAHP